MVFYNIADCFIPDNDSLNFKDYYDARLQGFSFKISRYLVMYHNGEEIAHAKLTKTDKSIKDNKEFNKLLKGALGVFDEKTADEDLIREFLDDVEYFIIEQLGGNPEEFYPQYFIQDLKAKPKDINALIDLAVDMQKHYYITGISNDGKREYFYCPNKNLKTYEPFDVLDYQRLIFERYEIRLPAKSCTDSLESIIIDGEMSQYHWELKDSYIDVRTGEIIKKENLKAPILTKRQFKLNGKLVSYDENVELLNDNPTLWETVIRQILVPKNNQNDFDYLNDFLCIASSCLETNDKWKLILILYNKEGNNGKTIVKDMLKLIFNNVNYEFSADNFKNDNFILSLADDTNILPFDEVKYSSFKGREDLFKRLSAGGLNKIGIRKMYSDKKHESKGMGMPMIFTNEVPEFNLDDALLDRLFFIKLPNKFVSVDKNFKLGENEYEKDPDLTKKLEMDFEGFSWFCNILIKFFFESEKPEQSKQIKKSVIYANSELAGFLTANYEYDEESRTTTPEIRDALRLNAYKLYQKESDNPRGLTIKIGKQLKEIFGEEVKTYEGGKTVKYKIRRVEE